MARPMTPEQIAATQAASKLAETAERQQHMAQAEQYTPTDKPPVASSLDPTAGQA